MRISYIFYIVLILLLLLISALVFFFDICFIYIYLFLIYSYLFNLHFVSLPSVHVRRRVCVISVFSFESCERRDSSSATFDIRLRTEVDWSCASCCCLLRCCLALASFLSVCACMCVCVWEHASCLLARVGSLGSACTQTYVRSHKHTHVVARLGKASLSLHTLSPLCLGLGQSIRADYRNFIYINLASTCCAN